MSKSDIVTSIKAIVSGAVDMSGNTVVNVLAKHNEYVIYEIETKDINNRIKVFIDGHTDESEAKIRKRFNAVKQKYIEAKGMLSKSSNFEMMKHRVAHTLSTALNSDESGGADTFENLIKTITKEHEQLVVNRALYLLPSVISVAFFFALCAYNLSDRVANGPWWQLFVVFIGSSLGGALSILINAKTLNFEEFQTKGYYFLLGVERIVLAYMAGGVAYVALKSGFLSSEILDRGYWSLMMVIVFSGFSESLVPGFLSKSEGVLHSNALQRTSR